MKRKGAQASGLMKTSRKKTSTETTPPTPPNSQASSAADDQETDGSTTTPTSLPVVQDYKMNTNWSIHLAFLEAPPSLRMESGDDGMLNAPSILFFDRMAQEDRVEDQARKLIDMAKDDLMDHEYKLDESRFQQELGLARGPTAASTGCSLGTDLTGAIHQLLPKQTYWSMMYEIGSIVPDVITHHFNWSAEARLTRFVTLKLEFTCKATASSALTADLLSSSGFFPGRYTGHADKAHSSRLVTTLGSLTRVSMDPGSWASSSHDSKVLVLTCALQSTYSLSLERQPLWPSASPRFTSATIEDLLHFLNDVANNATIRHTSSSSTEILE